MDVNKIDCGWQSVCDEEPISTCAHPSVKGPCQKLLGFECPHQRPVAGTGVVAFLDMGEEWAVKHGSRWEPNKEDMAAILLMNNVLFVSSRRGIYEYKGEQEILPETLSLLLNCNDTFAWGCADAEEVTYNELPEVYKAWLGGKWGTTKWVCIKRNEQPQKPMKDMMIKDSSWDETMESLPENHYTKYLREEAAKTK